MQKDTPQVQYPIPLIAHPTMQTRLCQYVCLCVKPDFCVSNPAGDGADEECSGRGPQNVFTSCYSENHEGTQSAQTQRPHTGGEFNSCHIPQTHVEIANYFTPGLYCTYTWSWEGDREISRLQVEAMCVNGTGKLLFRYDTELYLLVLRDRLKQGNGEIQGFSWGQSCHLTSRTTSSLV